MTQQDQAQQILPQQKSSSPLIFMSVVIIALAYFGFVRPAHQHMQALERQCNKLVIAVKKLQKNDDTARHGLELINLMEAQSDKLASAERALDKFLALNDRLVAEANSLSETTAALSQISDVREDIEFHGETLSMAATSLDDLGEISKSIAASSDITRETNGSLATMSEMQSDLTISVARLSDQLTDLEAQLEMQSDELPEAELALAQIEQLCEDLMHETKNIATAQRQLSQLVELKQNVLDQSNTTPAAEAALDQIWDLQDGLLQAKQTLDKAQQLAVDMMLLEPVLEQVTKSLQPAAEATRLSKRAAAKAPKTPLTASLTETAAPWSNALSVFVALLNPAN